MSTASEVAHGIRNGHLSARDVVERQLDRIARFNPALNAVVTRSMRTAHVVVRARPTAPWQTESCGDPSTEFLSPSRTHSILRAFVPSAAIGRSRDAFRSKTPRQWPACARPVRSSSARPTCRPSPAGFKPTTPCSGARTTPGICGERQAAVQAARRRPYRPVCRCSSWEAISVGRSGFRRTSAGSTASRQRLVGLRAKDTSQVRAGHPCPRAATSLLC